MKLRLLVLFLLFFIPDLSFGQVIVTAAGNGIQGYSGDGGPARDAEFDSPYGIALDDSGNLYICDEANSCIRKVSPGYGGTITTIAGGNGPGYSGDGGLATNARIYGAFDVAIDHKGNVYIADAGNNRIRKITPGDTITTVAGTGIAGYNGDGIKATIAELNAPMGIVVDSIGSIYVVDQDNYRIRKVDTAGVITTIAGTGIKGFSPDGSRADTAQLYALYDIALNNKGTIYFTDSAFVRKIDISGNLTIVAGNGHVGFSGDNGPAVSAAMSDWMTISIDDTDNVLIGDVGNSRIRKVNTAGIINTIGGGYPQQIILIH